MNEAMIEKLSHYSVLYAEDEEGVRSSVSEMLSLLFKEVHVAKDGAEAYEMFKELTVDIIITDIKMPNLSGIELAKKIREQDSNVHIIIISAHTEVDYMLDAIELSLVRYIVKPITETKLSEALGRFLELKEQRGEVYLAEGWIYDFDKKVTKYESTEFELTKKETKLLELLLKKKAVLTYEEIEMELWPEEYMSLNALRLFMKNFRKKLPPNSLKNIQSVGYKL